MELLLSSIIGFIVGFNIREIREAILKLGVKMNIRDSSAVIRGREIITSSKPQETGGKIVKPIDPKEVARRSNDKFLKDFDLY